MSQEAGIQRSKSKEKSNQPGGGSPAKKKTSKV